MATGLKTELQQIIGICDECKYTSKEIIKEYPVGTGPEAIESTGMITHGVHGTYLIVFPHRATCSQHSKHQVRGL